MERINMNLVVSSDMASQPSPALALPPPGLTHAILSPPNLNIYESLAFDSHSSQIRLLFLSPEDEDYLVDCLLAVYDVDKAPAYRAISYAWGDSHEDETIRVNDIPVSVRKNCQYALRQAQRHYPLSYIWIDAICIDQTNLNEKSVQVARMYDIYSAAQMTLACVGEDDGAAQMFFLAREIWPERDSLSVRWNCDELQDDEKRQLETLCELAYQFCKRPYFRRFWIIQELHAARQKGWDCIILLAGRQRIKWKFVVELKKFLWESNSPDSKHQQLGHSHIDELDKVIGWHAINFSTMAAWSPHFLCADPRDRIYGCLRIVQNGGAKQRLQIRPDYQKSRVALAIEAANILGIGSVDSYEMSHLGLMEQLVSMLQMDFRDNETQEELLIGVCAAEMTNTWTLRFDWAWQVVSNSQGQISTSTLQKHDNAGSANIATSRPWHRNSQEDIHRYMPIVNASGRTVALASHEVRPGDFITSISSISRLYFAVRQIHQIDQFELLGQVLVVDGTAFPLTQEGCLLDVHSGDDRAFQGGVPCAMMMGSHETLVLITQNRLTESGLSIAELEGMNLNLSVPARQILRETELMRGGRSLLRHRLTTTLTKTETFQERVQKYQSQLDQARYPDNPFPEFTPNLKATGKGVWSRVQARFSNSGRRERS